MLIALSETMTSVMTSAQRYSGVATLDRMWHTRPAFTYNKPYICMAAFKGLKRVVQAIIDHGGTVDLPDTEGAIRLTIHGSQVSLPARS